MILSPRVFFYRRTFQITAAVIQAVAVQVVHYYAGQGIGYQAVKVYAYLLLLWAASGVVPGIELRG